MAKPYKLFILLSFVYMTSDLQATYMQMNPNETREHTEEVLQYIEENSPVTLVLGVNNGEQGIDQRFNGSYIFLDQNQQNPNDPRSLTVNFNNQSQLAWLLANFKGRFDKIVIDDSVFKYLKWKDVEIKIMKALLKPGGQFIFRPYVDMVTYENSNLTKEEFMRGLFNSESFITSLVVPENLKQFYRENKMAIYKTVLLPKNYEAILKKGGFHNISVEERGNLPFPTNDPSAQQYDVVTATKE